MMASPASFRAATSMMLHHRIGRTITKHLLTRNTTMMAMNTSNNTTSNSSNSPSIGQDLAQLAIRHPNMDAIRYEHKNVKWSFKHIDYFAESLAIGFLENNLQAGDAILSWLPNHFSEQHILQFACSKAGFIFYHLDPELAQTDPSKAKEALSKALEITEATCLITQEAGGDVNYVNLVRQIIPEIRIFNFLDGMPFITPRYPNLRFPIHTGLDINVSMGMVPLKQMLVPSGEMDNFLEEKGVKLSGQSPLFGELHVDGKDGIPKLGKVLSNDDVRARKAWPHVCSILSKEYTEVEGVGVIF